MTKDLHKTCIIKSAPDVVFRALTEPNRIVRYFPVDRIDLDPKVGGILTIHGDAGGEAFTDHGVIEQFDRPVAFRYRYWSTNHGTEQVADNYMTIDYQIKRVDADCIELHLHHLNLLTDDRKTQMNTVWDYLLGELKTYVEDGSSAERLTPK